MIADEQHLFVGVDPAEQKLRDLATPRPPRLSFPDYRHPDPPADLNYANVIL